MARSPGDAAAVHRPPGPAVIAATGSRLGLGLVLAPVRYLGGAATLLLSTLRAPGRARPGDASLVRGAIHQVDRLVGLGWGVVALMHVGMGSFLAMQAYFGATFVDGIGPVVGVGLIRNLAPLLAGSILALIVAALFVADLRLDPGLEPTCSRPVAVRVLGAAVAGPLLGAWGALVGVAIGWAVGRSMMGVTEPVFFDLFWEMLWARDVIGLVVKGALFGGVAALLACHEARRPGPPGEDPRSVSSLARAAGRAAVGSLLAILAINGGWFLLVYHAGPAFGPTLLVPPGQ